MSSNSLPSPKLSMQPDKHMRWIYDRNHPDYNSDMAKDLRQRRDHALRSCPQWLRDEAIRNDQDRERAIKP